jgi:dUTP pyrophosphatase
LFIGSLGDIPNCVLFVFAMYLQCSLLTNDAIEPVRHGAGLDLYVPRNFNPVCPPHIPTTIDTHLAVQIPDGYYGQLALRSSVAQQGFVLLGGVIDSDYRGPIKVMMMNLNNSLAITLPSGTRFAQLLIIPIITPEPLLVQPGELTATARGSRGFGSTGQ